MASLPIAFANPAPLSPAFAKPHSIVGTAAPRARLSALEWSVVALAERDGIASIREPGRLASAMAALFGITRPKRLVDERLEALRRVAIYAWRHGWNVPKSEIAAFLGLGFTSDHLELIQKSISEARRDRQRRTVR